MSLYTVAQALAAATAGTPLNGDVIVDSAADIQANLDALQSLASAGKIAYVNFTDSGTPKIDITYAENQADATVIAMFEGQRTTVVEGATVAETFQIQGQQHVAIGVVDTEANIAANIDALSDIANEISSVTITDGQIPSFSLSRSINDSGVISHIVVAGIGAEKAVNDVGAILNMHGFAVSDTAANVSANITGLEGVALLGKLSSITLTDGGAASVAVSPTELFNDGSALKTIQGTFVLAVDGTDANLTLAAPTGITTELVLDGSPSQYSISASRDGTNITITEIGTGRSSTDHLSGFTAVQFDNGGSSAPTLVTLANTANNSFAEYTALLYQAALGRSPDPAGLESWIALANVLPASEQATGVYALSNYSGNYNGTLSIAAGFTNSAEFEAKYGSLTNAQFVTQLYSNILDRAPDSGGFTSWMKALTPVSQGGLGESRDYVLVGFAESVEAITNATQGFTGQSGVHAAWLFLT